MASTETGASTNELEVRRHRWRDVLVGMGECPLGRQDVETVVRLAQHAGIANRGHDITVSRRTAGTGQRPPRQRGSIAAHQARRHRTRLGASSGTPRRASRQDGQRRCPQVRRPDAGANDDRRGKGHRRWRKDWGTGDTWACRDIRGVVNEASVHATARRHADSTPGRAVAVIGVIGHAFRTSLCARHVASENRPAPRRTEESVDRNAGAHDGLQRSRSSRSRSTLSD